MVSGEREGNALAITLQRQSTGVKNVVSADAFGALAGNPADLVMRLPGVVGDSVGGDIRYVSIRGMNRDLSTVTMDGNRMADAASDGATREFQFQQVGSDAIERIEVVKSPTPDMDADSIGGAVNMVTKSAFDRAPGRRINCSFGLNLASLQRASDEPGGGRELHCRPTPRSSANELGVTFNYGMREHAERHRHAPDMNHAGRRHGSGLHRSISTCTDHRNHPHALGRKPPAGLQADGAVPFLRQCRDEQAF